MNHPKPKKDLLAMANAEQPDGGTFTEEMIDSKAVAARVANHKQVLFQKIRDDLYTALSGMEPHETLSFYLTSGGVRCKTVTLSASLEYCGVLIAFMQSKKHQGYDVDSFVTPIAMQVVEKAIAGFYATPEVAEELATALTNQLAVLTKVQETVRSELAGQQKWIGKEMGGLLKTNLGEVITSEMAEKLAYNVHAFVQTSAGKTLLTTLGKLLASGTGKILVTKIAIVVGQVVASAAFQTAMIAIVKKIGITVLVKTAIGKAIIAVLAILGISTSIPIVWIIAPLIIGFLAYGYVHLSAKTCRQGFRARLVDVLDGKFEGINDQIIKEIISGIFSHLMSDLMGKLSRHDAGMPGNRRLAREMPVYTGRASPVRTGFLPDCPCHVTKIKY